MQEDSGSESEYEEEAEPETEDEQYSDYGENPDIKEVQELGVHYSELLFRKFILIQNYHKNIDTDKYLLNLAMINKELNEIDFDMDTVKKEVIEKEIELNIALEEIERKEIVSQADIIKIDNIKEQLEILFEKYKEAENEEDELEPLELEATQHEDDFLNNEFWENYENEEDDKLLKFAMKQSGVSSKEKVLKIAARKYNINPEQMRKGKSYEYDIFLKSLREQYPSGYTRAPPGIRKLGNEVYTLVEPGASMKSQLKEMKDLRTNLPIKLSEDDQKRSMVSKLLKKFLYKMDETQLRNCILNAKSSNENPVYTYPVKTTNEEIIGRVSSKFKLIRSLKRHSKASDEILNNRAGLLENYIFKITKPSQKDYNKKINDMLFIFEVYENFATKFVNGEINEYRLASFENALTENNILKVYPVNLGTRKNKLQQIFQELYIATRDIPILRLSQLKAKGMLVRESKRLERIIFDLAHNSPDYIIKIKQIIAFIRTKNNVLFKKPESIIELFNIPSKSETQQDNYKNLKDINEIKAIIIEKQIKLQHFEKEKRQLESKNNTAEYVIFWHIPVKIPSEKRKIYTELLQKLKLKLSIPEKTQNDKELIHTYLTQLNKMKTDFSYTYKLDFIPGLDEKRKNIAELSEQLKQLNKLYMEMYLRQIEITRKESPVLLEEKVSVSKEYPLVNYLTINELVKSIKRTISSKLPIGLLELYDINELNMEIDKQNQLAQEPYKVYLLVKQHLLAQLPPNFNNNALFFKAIEEVLKSTGIKVDMTTPKNTIKELTRLWNPEFQGEKLLDFYGENVFEKLLSINNPFDFYKPDIYREYTELLDKFTQKQQLVYRKPRVTYNGKLYDVQYLDKNWATGKPLVTYEKEYEKDPKTQEYKVVNKIGVQRGKYPFIKIQLRTENITKAREVWKEVSPGQVKYHFGLKKNKNKSK